MKLFGSTSSGFRGSNYGPTPLYIDSDSAKKLVLNEVFHERTKYVEMALLNSFVPLPLIMLQISSQRVIPHHCSCS